MRAGAGVARLDPAIDATLPEAKAEDLPAAVLYQRLAPAVSRRAFGRSRTGGASRPRKERQEHRLPLVARAAVRADRAAPSLGSAYEGEHNAHDDDDDRHPKE
jgi:hypothetical protein